MSTTTDGRGEHDDDRDTRAVELLRDLVSIGPANALGLRRRRPMADTATAHGSADGQGASEERQRIDMIRHAHEVRVLSRLTIDERLQELGQRPKGVPPYELHFDVLLALADEAFALRAEVAAQRPVVAAVAAMHPLDDEMGYCLFCSVTREGQQHDADCPWVCALALAQSAHGSAPDAGQ